MSAILGTMTSLLALKTDVISMLVIHDTEPRHIWSDHVTGASFVES